MRPSRPPRITVVARGPEHLGPASVLARRLGLPVSPEMEAAGGDLILLVDDHGLGLAMPGERMRPVRVDFTGGRMRHRARATGQEAVVRAVGAARTRQLRILDATAGLGRDAFVLASHGCTVHLAERDPILAAMLADGIARLRASPAGGDVARRLHLHPGDALDLLASPRSGGPDYDCIYLDPLFPERTKTALVKKEMRVVRLLTGGQEDAAGKRLLVAALRSGAPRIVVKRPRLAPPLAGQRPASQITGRASRFDIYLRP